ncbi:MAG: hypothetical protein AAGI01_12270 [Myxococcota bacterium]
MSWTDWFAQRSPRGDLQESFPNDLLEDDAPLLLQSIEYVSSLIVAVRVLHAIAARGGTRLKPSMWDDLARRTQRVLPEHVVHHAEDEARRILEWLERAVKERGPEEEKPPELALMSEADLKVRASVASFAMGAGLDLEFEYHDELEDLWLRLRATPVEIDEMEDTLRVTAGAAPISIPFASIRWLMPVRHKEDGVVVRPRPEGKVLRFPFGTKLVSLEEE